MDAQALMLNMLLSPKAKINAPPRLTQQKATGDRFPFTT
jgi:hypothetical protein